MNVFCHCTVMLSTKIAFETLGMQCTYNLSLKVQWTCKELLLAYNLVHSNKHTELSIGEGECLADFKTFHHWVRFFLQGYLQEERHNLCKV